MPDLLDLSSLRSSGLQPNETLMADTASTPAAAVIHENAAVVSQLVEMGFPADACRRAVHLTQDAGLEAAMAWVMEHMDDPDFSSPFPPPAAATAAVVAISEENVAMVMSMGFGLEQAQAALRNTDNNVERAVEWIFSHPEGEEAAAAAQPPAAAAATSGQQANAAEAGLSDGAPRYDTLRITC
jgi:ubiquitin carboxyl-terminal hydrolase 5/13